MYVISYLIQQKWTSKIVMSNRFSNVNIRISFQVSTAVQVDNLKYMIVDKVVYATELKVQKSYLYHGNFSS